jgi:hypothetical protein
MRFRSNNFIQFLVIGILFSGSISCSKKDQPGSASVTGIQNFSIIPGNDIANMDLSRHWISVRVPDSIVSGTALAASFTITRGSSFSVNGQIQQSGITKNDFENDLHYTLTAADQRSQQDWTVQAFNNDYSLPWGLGHFINSYASNNKNYDWYIDQSTSGNFAPVNCGPASVTMAIKWADPDFTKTALDARMTYEVSGGWWFTSDIDSYLTDNNITHAIIALTDRADSTAAMLKQQLMNQQIIILCLDMNYVRGTTDILYRTDKFYATTPDWGHFIVLKGYKIADGELFFEAYDPFSFGMENDDNTLKGMNRYYRFEDLAAACLPWWNYAFVIAKKGTALSLDAVNRKLNPAHVPAAHSANLIF